jgi:hypothetical protein
MGRLSTKRALGPPCLLRWWGCIEGQEFYHTLAGMESGFFLKRNTPLGMNVLVDAADTDTLTQEVRSLAWMVTSGWIHTKWQGTGLSCQHSGLCEMVLGKEHPFTLTTVDQHPEKYEGALLSFLRLCSSHRTLCRYLRNLQRIVVKFRPREPVARSEKGDPCLAWVQGSRRILPVQTKPYRRVVKCPVMKFGQGTSVLKAQRAPPTIFD